MRRKGCFYFFLALNVAVYSQDTIRIRSMKDYREGKINMLVSPRGNQVIVRILNRSENWEVENEQEAEVDTEEVENDGGRSLAARPNRMVDPHLTEEQRDRIRQNACINARFAGLSRSKVKTSITQNQKRSYPSLAKFLITLFPDTDMKVVIRALAKPYAVRAIQEDKSVTVKNVFLLAYAKEKDNDYHLILTNAERTAFFNAELSGLPGNSAQSYQKLKDVRLSFENFPGEINCGKYIVLETPLRIRSIKGSLFFDVDHPAGKVGPLGARPRTAWEIHPVTEIEFD